MCVHLDQLKVKRGKPSVSGKPIIAIGFRDEQAISKHEISLFSGGYPQLCLSLPYGLRSCRCSLVTAYPATGGLCCQAHPAVLPAAARLLHARPTMYPENRRCARSGPKKRARASVLSDLTANCRRADP